MIPERIRDVPAWCVSDKNKVPLDIYALARGQEWGASTKRSHSCYTTYQKAVEAGRAKGYKPCLLVDSLAQSIVMLDIEPECPKAIRQALVLALHDSILYAERSLSGKGWHLMCGLQSPEDLSTQKYRKWFEVLSKHHCTFTLREESPAQVHGAEVPENGHVALWDEDVNPEDLDAKQDHDLLELLSRPISPKELWDWLGRGKPQSVIAESADAAAYRAAVSGFDGRHADLFNALCDLDYQKTVDRDFHGDMSSYEFGYASKMHYLLKRLSMDMMDDRGNHYELPLTKTESVMLVYMALKQSIPEREKHKEVRNGLPWLLYTSERVYAKTFE